MVIVMVVEEMEGHRSLVKEESKARVGERFVSMIGNSSYFISAQALPHHQLVL